MKRRHFLAGSSAAIILPTLSGAQDAERFEVMYTPDEWREMLGDTAFHVMREEGTERAFTSPLNDVTAEGMFHCKGCDQALYSSETKFESGTGWPSFYAPVENAVATKPDRSWFTTRTEVHCDRCGSHMGHIFDDGPPPTGKRHCINGVAMVFRPAGPGEPVIG